MPTLEWLDRAQALTAADRVPYRVLEPVSSHGNGDSENLLIQGDNLDALKALLPFYRGKVKCVFIDPPYNTKSAFEHYDDYPVIADLKPGGEEFDCAVAIDRHPNVRYWVRNPDNDCGFLASDFAGALFP